MNASAPAPTPTGSPPCPATLRNRTRFVQILADSLGRKEPRPINLVESPYVYLVAIGSDQNLNWDIFVVGRFRNFERRRTVAIRTPEA